MASDNDCKCGNGGVACNAFSVWVVIYYLASMLEKWIEHLERTP